MTSSDQHIGDHMRERYPAAALSVVSGFTHEAAPGMHGPTARATKPAPAGVGMMRFIRRIRGVFADPARVSMCDSCGSVSVCDTACRAGAARDRAVTRYLYIGLPR